MTAISIFGGEYSHRQAWTHQPGVEARRFVCLVLCAMFAGAVCMYALRLGVCESTVHCLGRSLRVPALFLKRMYFGERELPLQRREFFEIFPAIHEEEEVSK